MTLQKRQVNLFFDQTNHKSDDRHDGKNNEQYFGDLNGSCSDAAKAKHSRNQGDNKKNNRIVQHEKLLERVELKGISAEIRLNHP